MARECRNSMEGVKCWECGVDGHREREWGVEETENERGRRFGEHQWSERSSGRGERNSERRGSAEEGMGSGVSQGEKVGEINKSQ